MIINKIYETQSSVAVACFLPGRAKDLSAPLYMNIKVISWKNSPLDADSGSCDQEIVSILQNLKAYITMYSGDWLKCSMS